MAVGLINIQEQLKIARIADHDVGGLKVCESHVVRPSTNLIIEGNRRAGSVVALFNPVGLNTQERLDSQPVPATSSRSCVFRPRGLNRATTLPARRLWCRCRH